MHATLEENVDEVDHHDESVALIDDMIPDDLNHLPNLN